MPGTSRLDDLRGKRWELEGSLVNLMSPSSRSW
jgi:hypothetical protein